MTEGFDVFDDFDRWFWWFWCFWQQVLMILTGGFCFWRLYFKSCYTHRRFCPLKTLLSGNSPPTHSVYKWVRVFYINQKEKTWATWAWTVYRRSTSPACPERKPVRFTPAISPETSPDRKTLCPTPPSSPVTSLDSVFLYGKTIYII